MSACLVLLQTILAAAAATPSIVSQEIRATSVSAFPTHLDDSVGERLAGGVGLRTMLRDAVMSDRRYLQRAKGTQQDTGVGALALGTDRANTLKCGVCEHGVLLVGNKKAH